MVRTRGVSWAKRWVAPLFGIVTVVLVACSGGSDDGSGATPGDDAGLAQPTSDAATQGDDGSTPGPDGATPVDAAADVHQPDPHLGLSAGCGNAGAGKGLQSRTMTIANVSRSYLRFIPPTYKPNVPMALVVGLHGSGGQASSTRTTFDLESHANGKAIFIYPQALPSPDPAFNGAARWDPTKDSDDFKFFDALLAEVEASHCIDRDRVFVTGFSLGARFTSNIGCWRGDVLRAIAPVAPGGDANTLPLNDCVGEVGIWEGWGTLDPDHKVGAERVRDVYSAANGCTTSRTPTTPTGCEAYVGCRPEVPSIWCTYTLNHAWPDIAPAGVWGFFDGFQ